MNRSIFVHTRLLLKRPFLVKNKKLYILISPAKMANLTKN